MPASTTIDARAGERIVILAPDGQTISRSYDDADTIRITVSGTYTPPAPVDPPPMPPDIPPPPPDVTPPPPPPTGGGSSLEVAAGSGLAAAIAAAPAGSTLTLRGGDHLVSSLIYISKGLTLAAYPGETPVITHPTVRPDYIYVRNNTGPVNFYGLTFKCGTSTRFDDSQGSALSECDTGSNNVTYDGCTFIGHPSMSSRQQCLYLNTGVGNFHIQNCRFLGNGTGGDGIEMYHDPGATGITIDNCYIHDYALGIGVTIDATVQNLVVKNCDIGNNLIGIQHRKSLGTSLLNNHGSNNGTDIQRAGYLSYLTESGNTFT